MLDVIEGHIKELEVPHSGTNRQIGLGAAAQVHAGCGRDSGSDDLSGNR